MLLNCFWTEADRERALINPLNLGELGSFCMQPFVVWPSIEEFFVYGTMGVGSANDFLRPEISEALQCSQDLVTLCRSRAPRASSPATST